MSEKLVPQKASVPQIPQCLNCNAPLSATEKYCPVCGQKGSKLHLSIFEFLGEVFSNYLAWDSKLGRSVYPFLLKPGFLTNRFNSGQRAAYIHPLRLYLILSVFFFFSLTVSWDHAVERVEAKNGGKLDKEEVVERVVREMFGRYSSKKDKASRQEMAPADSLQSRALVASVGLDSLSIASKKTNSLTIGAVKDWEGMSDDEVVDSLDITVSGSFANYQREILTLIVQKLRKLATNDISFFAYEIFGNLSLMMIIMIPFFALLLKVLYIRRPFVYIDHLIHSIHIHSLAYLLYGSIFFLSLYLESTMNLVWGALLFVTVYAFLSFKRVYKQGYRKTIFKFINMGWLYSVMIIVAFCFELLISVFFY